MLSGPSLAFLKSAKVAWLVEENDSQVQSQAVLNVSHSPAQVIYVLIQILLNEGNGYFWVAGHVHS